jgi:uncharacterized damage-inducible protein DinB
MMNKIEILDQLAESRQTFLHALEGLSEAQITQDPVEGIWTIKDLLAHLTSWENSCLIPLRAYAAGGSFIPEAIPDHHLWNHAQAQRWQTQSLAEIMAEYQAIRGEFVALVSALPEAKWAAKLPAPWGGEATMAELCSGLIWHEKTEHLKSIHQWKETGKPR